MSAKEISPMPWKETCVMDARTEFIVDWKRGVRPMTALCEAYGISRKTGYKWRDRFLAGGFPGLADQSRARHELGHRMAEEMAAAVKELREQHELLGPRKLKAVLERERPDETWPAASTIGDLLRREGLSEPRRRRRRPLPVTQPFAEARQPNDVWCIDFKGWFRTRDGRRCDPLTVSDAVSRYVLACRIVEPTLAGVRLACERLFRESGLPWRLRMDNGPPFASSGVAGLSQLSVWWLKLGIALERIDPGAPQQNGRHERMHGTLKKHTSQPPAETLPEQQARFDEFMTFFNTYRPHQALDQQTPASCYTASPRAFPERLQEPWYDADHAVRRVRPTGEIRWGGDLIFVSEALAGEPVGIAETADGDWLLRFFDLKLGLINRKTKKIFRFAAARPGRRKAEQNRKTVTHVPGP
jgi:putative transposase